MLAPLGRKFVFHAGSDHMWGPDCPDYMLGRRGEASSAGNVPARCLDNPRVGRGGGSRDESASQYASDDTGSSYDSDIEDEDDSRSAEPSSPHGSGWEVDDDDNVHDE